MKRALGSQLALLAALGISSWHPTPVEAIQFDQAEIADPARFVVMASPIGTTSSYKLLIFEQLNDRRLCWQETGSNPTAIAPLFLEFDFTGICGRSTDSNAYSVRVAGEDLGGRYNLRLARKQNELVLVAYSLIENSAKFIEIGRTSGLTDGFIKIKLDPGWRLTRRSYQGKPVGHLYFTSDRTLPELINTAAPLTPTPVAPAPTTVPSSPTPTLPSVQPNPGGYTSPAPTLPAPPASIEPLQPVQPVQPLQPAPSVPSPAAPLLLESPQPLQAPIQSEISPANPPQTNPPQTIVVPSIVVPTAPLNTTPSAAPKGLPAGERPRSSVIVPLGSSINTPNSEFPSAASSSGYRVVVVGATPEQQEQVRQLVPGAFRTTIGGQTMMQVGVFRDRATANALQQQLASQNVRASVLSTTINAAAPIPAPAINPSSSFSAYSSAFNLPQLNIAAAQSYSLWATYYSTHRAENAFNGYPLLDLAGNSLGITLSQRDWCAAALEGSVQVMSGAQNLGTYNFAGRGDTAQVDCSTFYPKLSTVSATNRVRFKLSNTLYGEGVGGNSLVPYRTIAVDKSLIPIGSVVYIPEARGTWVTLPSGGQVVHDGYFYAADVGAAIRGNHIDVFVGTADRNPFPFVKSSSTATFSAYIVSDPRIQAVLAAQHRFTNTAAQVRR